MRQVEQIMGMPIVVDILNCEDEAIFHKVFTSFHKIDAQFSPYKKDSEVSRFKAGKLNEPALSDELKMIIKACLKAEEFTNGYFSAWANGTFDPSGYVKGWAIAEAGKLIEKEGYKTYCISAGGDILARSDSEKKWNIGIQHPKDKPKILNKLNISNGAVATSGNYERGTHIINPKTKQPADELLSVTVTGPNIIKADVLATACFAMGQKSTEFMKFQKDYQALIISHNQGSNR
ncbi:FAD:protein FMN transferase [Candidatus Saccharibacteria bacterium]|nr:FAD:protein FMN transferase [Candidatus Saccharibacteria bacterium]